MEEFGNGLGHYLEQQLETDGFGDTFRKQIGPEIHDIVLPKALKRSVTGSMADMVNLATYMLVEDGKTLKEATAQLNKTPFSAINNDHPLDIFLTLAGKMLDCCPSRHVVSRPRVPSSTNSELV